MLTASTRARRAGRWPPSRRRPAKCWARNPSRPNPPRRRLQHRRRARRRRQPATPRRSDAAPAATARRHRPREKKAAVSPLDVSALPVQQSAIQVLRGRDRRRAPTAIGISCRPFRRRPRPRHTRLSESARVDARRNGRSGAEDPRDVAGLHGRARGLHQERAPGRSTTASRAWSPLKRR